MTNWNRMVIMIMIRLSFDIEYKILSCHQCLFVYLFVHLKCHSDVYLICTTRSAIVISNWFGPTLQFNEKLTILANLAASSIVYACMPMAARTFILLIELTMNIQIRCLLPFLLIYGKCGRLWRSDLNRSHSRSGTRTE